MLKIVFFLFFMSRGYAADYIKDLSKMSTIPLDSLKNEKTLIMLFRTNCSSCHRQVRDLKCLEKKFKIVLMGAFALEKDLKREYIKFKTSYPAYYASKDILKKIGVTSKATPQVFTLANRSQLLSLGFQSCLRLKKLINAR